MKCYFKDVECPFSDLAKRFSPGLLCMPCRIDNLTSTLHLKLNNIDSSIDNIRELIEELTTEDEDGNRVIRGAVL